MENIIEVQEEVQIGNVIIEKGDKIQIVECIWSVVDETDTEMGKVSLPMQPTKKDVFYKLGYKDLVKDPDFGYHSIDIQDSVIEVSINDNKKYTLKR